jgi:hypothetical protein
MVSQPLGRPGISKLPLLGTPTEEPLPKRPVHYKGLSESLERVGTEATYSPEDLAALERMPPDERARVMAEASASAGGVTLGPTIDTTAQMERRLEGAAVQKEFLKRPDLQASAIPTGLVANSWWEATLQVGEMVAMAASMPTGAPIVPGVMGTVGRGLAATAVKGLPAVTTQALPKSTVTRNFVQQLATKNPLSARRWFGGELGFNIGSALSGYVHDHRAIIEEEARIHAENLDIHPDYVANLLRWSGINSSEAAFRITPGEAMIWSIPFTFLLGGPRESISGIKALGRAAASPGDTLGQIKDLGSAIAEVKSPFGRKVIETKEVPGPKRFEEAALGRGDPSIESPVTSIHRPVEIEETSVTEYARNVSAEDQGNVYYYDPVLTRDKKYTVQGKMSKSLDGQSLFYDAEVYDAGDLTAPVMKASMVIDPSAPWDSIYDTIDMDISSAPQLPERMPKDYEWGKVYSHEGVTGGYHVLGHPMSTRLENFNIYEVLFEQAGVESAGGTRATGALGGVGGEQKWTLGTLTKEEWPAPNHVIQNLSESRFYLMESRLGGPNYSVFKNAQGDFSDDFRRTIGLDAEFRLDVEQAALDPGRPKTAELLKEAREVEKQAGIRRKFKRAERERQIRESPAREGESNAERIIRESSDTTPIEYRQRPASVQAAIDAGGGIRTEDFEINGVKATSKVLNNRLQTAKIDLAMDKSIDGRPQRARSLANEIKASGYVDSVPEDIADEVENLLGSGTTKGKTGIEIEKALRDAAEEFTTEAKKTLADIDEIETEAIEAAIKRGKGKPLKTDPAAAWKKKYGAEYPYIKTEGHEKIVASLSEPNMSPTAQLNRFFRTNPDLSLDEKLAINRKIFTKTELGEVYIPGFSAGRDKTRITREITRDGNNNWNWDRRTIRGQLEPKERKRNLPVLRPATVKEDMKAFTSWVKNRIKHGVHTKNPTDKAPSLPKPKGGNLASYPTRTTKQLYRDIKGLGKEEGISQDAATATSNVVRTLHLLGINTTDEMGLFMKTADGNIRRTFLEETIPDDVYTPRKHKPDVSKYYPELHDPVERPTQFLGRGQDFITIRVGALSAENAEFLRDLRMSQMAGRLPGGPRTAAGLQKRAGLTTPAEEILEDPEYATKSGWADYARKHFYEDPAFSSGAPGVASRPGEPRYAMGTETRALKLEDEWRTMLILPVDEAEDIAKQLKPQAYAVTKEIRDYRGEYNRRSPVFASTELQMTEKPAIKTTLDDAAESFANDMPPSSETKSVIDQYEESLEIDRPIFEESSAVTYFDTHPDDHIAEQLARRPMLMGREGYDDALNKIDEAIDSMGVDEASEARMRNTPEYNNFMKYEDLFPLETDTHADLIGAVSRSIRALDADINPKEFIAKVRRGENVNVDDEMTMAVALNNIRELQERNVSYPDIIREVAEHARSRGTGGDLETGSRFRQWTKLSALELEAVTGRGPGRSPSTGSVGRPPPQTSGVQPTAFHPERGE